jgi:hypothetical protein
MRTHTEKRRPRRAGAAFAAAALAVVAAAVPAPAGAGAAHAETPAETQPRPVGEMSTWRLGSFLLPPAPLGTASVNRPWVEAEKPCTDCFITGFVPRLVYADGSPADMTTGVMLHHVGLYDPTHPDPAARPCAAGLPAFGAGDERAPWFVMPPGFGFAPTPAPWTGFVEVMNHAPEPREVFLEADVYSVPATTPGMKPVSPVLLSVGDACSGMEYEAPAGRSATSVTWTATKTGRVVWGIGHVHAGGQGVVLDNVTTGRRICGSEASYGRPGPRSTKTDPMDAMVTSMSTCSWDSLGTVRKGDKLRVTSLYDSPRAVPEAMGIMSIAIYETRDLAGGSGPPESMHRTPDTEVPAGAGAGAAHSGPGGHGH